LAVMMARTWIMAALLDDGTMAASTLESPSPLRQRERRAAQRKYFSNRIGYDMLPFRLNGRKETQLS
jgi:hypothetical protein